MVNELNERFSNVDEIETEQDKKDFVKLFGEYLRIENILQNCDEYSHLKLLQAIDKENPAAVKGIALQKFMLQDLAALK